MNTSTKNAHYKQARALAIAAAMVSPLGAAADQLINVDFGGQAGSATGAAVLSGYNDFWNTIGIGNTTLYNATSVVGGAYNTTGTSLVMTGWEGSYGGASYGVSGHVPLTGDFAYDTNNSASLAINGLTPGETYTWVIYTNEGGAGRPIDITVDGTTKSSSGAIDRDALVEGVNYLTFTGVVPGSGTLTADFAFGAGNAGEMDVNGFQLQIAPPPPPAGATILNVDFGAPQATGFGVIGSTDDYWSNLDHTNNGAVIWDSTGVASGATLVLAGWSGTYGENSLGVSGHVDLTRDFIYNTSGTATLGVDGLTPGDAYTWVIYTNQGGGGRPIDITVDGTTQSSSNTINRNRFVEGVNYLTFTGVVPGSGSLTADLAFGAGNLGEMDVNGFQLQIVPGAGPGTYATWIGANPPATGFETDSDNDGIPNGVEHILNTDPNVASPGLTEISATGSSATFKHTLNPTIVSDVTASYEWSTDLIEWKSSGQTNTGGTTATITASAPVADVVTVTMTITSGPATKLFGRLAATLAP